MNLLTKKCINHHLVTTNTRKNQHTAVFYCAVLSSSCSSFWGATEMLLCRYAAFWFYFYCFFFKFCLLLSLIFLNSVFVCFVFLFIIKKFTFHCATFLYFTPYCLFLAWLCSATSILAVKKIVKRIFSYYFINHINDLLFVLLYSI